MREMSINEGFLVGFLIKSVFLGEIVGENALLRGNSVKVGNC